MKRISVESSSIASIGYGKTARTLEVGFTNGRIYQYFEVPETVHQKFQEADSKGTFFNENIKDAYRYIKL